MRLTIISLAIILFTLTNCKAQNSRVKIVQKIIDYPKVERILKPHVDKEGSLFILKNENFNQENHLAKFGKEVQLIQDTTGTEGNYLEVKKLDIGENKTKFAIFYKIEGMEFHGTLKRKNNKWSMEKFSYFEN